MLSAVDAVGTQYLCLLAEIGEEDDKFVCAPVSPSRLADFERGQVDLVDLLRDPQLPALYTGVSPHGEASFVISAEEAGEIPDEWFPDPGFFLDPFEVDSYSYEEALGRNKAVVHLSFNPPEARDAHKIEVGHLVDGLGIFQRFVRHAFSKSVSRLSQATQRLVKESESAGMEVYAFSPGSFKVHLQSKSSADIVGYVDIEKALSLIDTVIAADASDIETLSSLLRENKGHFISAYKSLLEFIIQNDSPIRYEWAAPDHPRPVQREISTGSAAYLYDVLTAYAELAVESVEFVGYVTKADAKRGMWTVQSQDGEEEYNGTIAEGSPASLSGITIETELYRFSCQELLEEVPVTGAERKRLVLLNYEAIVPGT